MTERRLAAIVMVDAVGFTSRMEADERSAMAAIQACMELLERTIALNGGRVVKTMGDGLMAEFPSIVNAVGAAALMQSNIAERNRDLPAEARLAFRIGAHVGDVVAVDGDLFGDGVNIASRLEAAAPPGGVLISERAFADVDGKLDLAFEDRGEIALKGLARPMRCRLVRDGEAPGADASTPALPDKPSVAVLPFINMSADPEQEFFADGLTEDIITSLAGVPWIFVIARNSSFVYKGAAVDVRQVGRDLGVAYVLEGSVRRAGKRLRVTGQLIDAADGKHLWAERMDGALEDVFDLQDQITDAVTRAIAPEIQTAEIARARAKRPESLTAYDHLLQGLAALHRAQNPEARGHLEKAIEAAPDYGKALALRSWCSTLQIAWEGRTDYDAVQAEGLDYARRALAADGSDQEVAAYSGYTLAFFGGDVEGGIALVRSAVEACPSFHWARSSLGMLQGLHEDDPEGTLQLVDEAMRLSPKDPLRFRNLISKAHCFRQLGRYEEQLAAAKEAYRLSPNVSIGRINMIVALHSLGRIEEAKEEWTRLLTWNPGFEVEGFLAHSSKFQSAYGHNTHVGPALRDIAAQNARA